MRIITLTRNHPQYDQITTELCTEPLRSQWWDDAESHHEPGISYSMVIHDEVPAAWAGWTFEREDGRPVLRCCNNYVRREYRGGVPDLYALAYAHRHRHIVTHLGMPAVTYLFPEPVALHLADGWVIDTSPGSSGTSWAREVGQGQEHHWRRLRWTPPPR